MKIRAKNEERNKNGHIVEYLSSVKCCFILLSHENFQELEIAFGNMTVESRRGNGELTACEVILFHHEDMGIPWEIIKFGARQGMWGAVKKIERGLRAYQEARACGEPISHCASMARINTKIDPVHLKSLEGDEDSSSSNTDFLESSSKKPGGVNIPKILFISGAVAVACTLDGGLLPKALLFDIARRLSNLGRGTRPGT